MEKNFQLRPYQIKLSKKGYNILTKLNIVYLCMEVRTGKTLTSLEIARLFGAKNVLFSTKKKGIPSIEKDYQDFNYKFKLTVVNDESLHKVEGVFDLVIHDEHHRFGAFPKMGRYTKMFKEKYSHLPMIFLSGTPHPESYSQIFHQFHVSDSSPFREYKNFYRWANDYVDVTKKHLGYAVVNDYTKAHYKEIVEVVGPYFIRYTQKKAGFTTKVNETILTCRMKTITYELCDRLIKDRVIEGGGEVILADTAVKLQQKLHQMYSGTVKFESGKSFMFDNSKAVFIKKKFKGQRIGIFYKFVEELNALKTVFDLTQDVEAFNNYEYDVIALQFLSGREAISLRTADALVYYNIDFSAVTYFHSKDRLTTKDRKENDVYWIFSEDGIEQNIYETVCEKKNYTISAFKRDYKI